MRPPSHAPSLDLLTHAVLDREPFIAVIGDQAGDLAAVLDATSDALAERAVRFVRVRGGPSAPLTVAEVVRTVGEEEDGDGANDAARVVRALTRRHGDEEQVVLAVEHAETLQPQVLAFLQLLPAIRTDGSPILQVMFAGRADFWTLLDGEAFRPLRDQLATCVTIPRAERSAAPLASDAQRRGRVVVAGLLVCAAAIVVGFGLVGYDFFYRRMPYQSAAVRQPVERAAPEPIPAAAAAPAAPPPTEAPPADTPPAVVAPAAAPSAAPAPASDVTAAALAPTPPAEAAPAMAPVPAEPNAAPVIAASPQAQDRERLRREFDAFLDQSAAARLSEAQRELLFEQYLARRGVPAPVAQDQRPGPAGRVVIHYPAGSASGAAEAVRLQSKLRADAEQSETRPVSHAPQEPVIRYFFAEDAATAETIAADLHGSGANWHVQDFTANRPRPARGTVEVWLPEPE
ncbi:MAG TPA: hypothetical protein VLJ20_08180 [Acetobacteraceae bacterium]|nr:hypothetical protein [Acetobacteraceae bacterium]